MKRNSSIYRALVAMLVAVTLLCGTASAAQTTQPHPVADSMAVDYDTYVYGNFRSRVAALDDGWLGLSTEQRLADWDHMYQSLVQNYPYFEVVRRTTGVDMHAAYRDVRAQIPGYSDTEYFLALFDYIQATGNAGHFSLYWPNGDAMESGAYRTLAPIMMQVVREYAALSGEAGAPNLTTSILEEGRIAYAHIRGFGWNDMIADEAPLLDFYRQIQNYDHLIIDVTGNTGGSMGYYMNLIMAPLLREPQVYFTYSFMKDGQLNREHMAARGSSLQVWNPLSTPPSSYRDSHLAGLPSTVRDTAALQYNALAWPPPQLPAADFAQLDRYWLNTTTLYPGLRVDGTAIDHIPFAGRIWLLVDGEVYSASESFAVACRQTGFATIVGTQTGGDGIGIDPVVFSLPNSGLQIRYAPVYGTTVDGRGSEEYGTTPDILSRSGERPLDTCLRAINAG